MHQASDHVFCCSIADLKDSPEALASSFALLHQEFLDFECFKAECRESVYRMLRWLLEHHDMYREPEAWLGEKYRFRNTEGCPDEVPECDATPWVSHPDSAVD